MKSDIDLYLISGFLGAGKTTFLKNMLQNLEGKKAGVLINEFGQIGIDGRFVEKDGLTLVEINNGSIFCCCLKGSFIKSLIDLSKTDIDLLIVENSGMADPSGIHAILDEIKGWVDRQYHYKGAVCIADSVNFLKQVQVLAPVQNQIAASNFIIINKTDLVSRSARKEVREKISELNPSAFLYETVFSKVPAEVLNEMLTDNGFLGETSNNPWNRPAIYSLECEGTFMKEKLTLFAERMAEYVYRMKGLMKNSKGWWQIDVTGDDIRINETIIDKKDFIKTSRLVIIGNGTDDIKNEIIKAWEAIFEVKPVIYDDFISCGT